MKRTMSFNRVHPIDINQKCVNRVQKLYFKCVKNNIKSIDINDI